MSKLTPRSNPYSGIKIPTYADPGDAPVKPVRPSNTGQMGSQPVSEEEWGRYQTELENYNTDYSAWLDKSMAGGFDSEGKPMSPEFLSMIDPDTGRLKEAYELKGEEIDPTKIGGYAEFQELATGDGLTKGAGEAQEMLDLKTRFARDQASADAGGARADAMSNLSMRGGMSSGARERINTGINPLQSRQDARRSQLLGTADIGMRSAESREGALKQFTGMGADLEQFNMNTRNQSQEYNINQALREMDAERNFAMDNYKEHSTQWAAKKKAEGQRSGGGGGGGCCFIFLEARYGNGTMDEVVRKFRDENMTDRNRRGYYKLTEVLVPLMRKSWVAKSLVRTLMTDPLVSYGKYYYKKGRIGRIFSPVKNFWLGVFDYLGQDHKYIRENGEVV